MTVVLTLKAQGIHAKGPMILTECRMARLYNGDKLHCTPALAAEMVKKYPENLVPDGDHYDRPGELACGQWEVESAGRPDSEPKPVVVAHTPPDHSVEAVVATNGNPGDPKAAAEVQLQGRRGRGGKPAPKAGGKEASN